MQGESCLNYILLFARVCAAGFPEASRPVGTEKQRRGGGGRGLPGAAGDGTGDQADFAGVSSLMRRNRSRAGTKRMQTRQAVKPPL